MPEGKPITIEECHAKVAECRALSMRAVDPAHKVMLEHMADTWARICADLAKAESN